jgi:general stress protein 26
MVKYYIHIKYSDKEEAKALKARWDADIKRWFVEDKNNPLLEKYQMIYLNAMYEERENAKKLGALYDSHKRQWFTIPSNPNYDELIELYTTN